MMIEGISARRRGKQGESREKHYIIKPKVENERGLAKIGTAEPVLRDQIL